MAGITGRKPFVHAASGRVTFVRPLVPAIGALVVGVLAAACSGEGAAAEVSATLPEAPTSAGTTPSSDPSSAPAATAAPAVPTVAWKDGLTELGFYAVAGGQVTALPFHDYGSGSTKRALRAKDFPELPTLGAADFLVLFGPEPDGVLVYQYRASGAMLTAGKKDREWSLGGCFSTVPQEPVRGTSLAKLTPRKDIPNGTYVLHRYVGMNGDSYVAFAVQR